MMINMEIMTTKSECRITWLIWHLQDQRVAVHHSFPDIKTVCVMCNFMYLTTWWTDLKLNLSSVILSYSSCSFYQYLHGVSPKETNTTHSHRFCCCYLNSLFMYIYPVVFFNKSAFWIPRMGAEWCQQLEKWNIVGFCKFLVNRAFWIIQCWIYQLLLYS